MTIRFAPHVDLFYDDTWNDITTDVRVSDGINISRGRSDEASRVDPTTCRLTIDNTNGKYSPRNPLSVLYGKIGRNTPIRVYEGTPSGTAVTVVSDNFTRTATTNTWAEVAGLPWIAWNLLDPSEVWTTGTTGKILLGDILPRNVYLDVSLTDCELLTSFSVDQAATGAALSAALLFRRVAISEDGQYYWLRANLNSGGSSITLKVVKGSTELATASAAATYSAGGKLWLKARIEGYRLRGKIWADGGSEPGSWEIDYTITDANGTLVPSGAVGVGVAAVTGNTNVDPTFTFDDFSAKDLLPDERRFVGEVTNWPQKWDVSGKNIYTPIEASGIFRRLGQGASPLRSAIFRELTAHWRGSFQAYWPMEDGENATTFASAVSRNGPMKFTGELTPASAIRFAASAPLPTMGTGVTNGAVSPYTATGETAVRALVEIPDAGLTDATKILAIETTGSAARWELLYGTVNGGSLKLRALDSDGTELLASSLVDFNLNGTVQDIGFNLVQDGADVDYTLVGVVITYDEEIGLVTGGTLTSQTVGSVTRVKVAPDGNQAELIIGHVLVASELDQLSGHDDYLNGWTGETAGARMRRLCAEEGVTFISYGDLSRTAQMGPQGIKTFLESIEECVAADGGMLKELRSDLGFMYIPQSSLYNQTAAATLSYSGGNVSEPFDPVEDDQSLRNDVEVRRDAGSSYRVTKTSGPLSITSVGRYEDSLILNLGYDDQLPGTAGWRLHLGTYDELRYPTVTVDLAKNPSLKAAVTAVDSGKIFKVTGLPSWLPPDDLFLIVQGYDERLDEQWWTWTANTTPGGLWYVTKLDDTTYGRLETSGSSLAIAVDSDDTSFSVATDSTYQVWIDSAAYSSSFPFKVKLGGEVISVTAISGTTSPQTFTVTRSVNGIVKSHTAGTQVQLAR